MDHRQDADSTTRLAVIFRRAPDAKTLGPLVERALARGWRVECWADGEAPGGSKDYQRVRPDLAPALEGRVTWQSYDGEAGLEALARAARVDACAAIYPSVLSVAARARAGGVRPLLVLVQENLDTLLLPADAAELGVADLNAMFSPFWAELGRRYHPVRGDDFLRAFEDQFLPRAQYVGCVEVDNLGRTGRAEARARLGLPADQRLVLLLPLGLRRYKGDLPRIVLAGSRWLQIKEVVKRRAWRFWRYALGGRNESALYGAILEFVRANDARLVLKMRAKDQVPPPLAEAGALIVYDDSYYPATILDLLRAADLVIHFYSTAALEAAQAGTPAICVGWEAVDPNPVVGILSRLWRHGGPDHAFNTEGVNRWMSMGELIRRLPAMRLESFAVDPARRRAYVERFLGPDDGGASDRLLDAIGQKLGQL